MQQGENCQNDTDNTVFESEGQKVHFPVVSLEDLDQLERQEYEQATHWQTSWAVKCFKGTYQQLSFKFFVVFYEKSHVADDYLHTCQQRMPSFSDIT